MIERRALSDELREQIPYLHLPEGVTLEAWATGEWDAHGHNLAPFTDVEEQPLRDDHFYAAGMIQGHAHAVGMTRWELIQILGLEDVEPRLSS